MIGSTIAINPGTRITSDRQEDICAVISTEAFGLVIENSPAAEWRHDRIEVLIGDEIYWVHRTPAGWYDGAPFFNIRIIEDE